MSKAILRRSPAPLVRNTRIDRVFKDISGNTYGRLTVVERINFSSKKVMYKCACFCGNEYIAESHALRKGVTGHCGCDSSARRKAATTHGKRHSRVYYAWKNMMNRCYVPTTRGYRHYGGRGITVHVSWHIFENFYRDMGDPGEGMTLERCRVNEGYSKDNCRWATASEQARNRRNTLRVVFRNETRVLADLAEEKDIPYKILHQRITMYGMSINRALLRRSFK